MRVERMKGKGEGISVTFEGAEAEAPAGGTKGKMKKYGRRKKGCWVYV